MNYRSRLPPSTPGFNPAVAPARESVRGRRRPGFPGVLLALFVGGLPLGAEPGVDAEGAGPVAPAYEPPMEIARLSDPGISESSGLAASLKNPGCYWTHNDSGDGPRLYLIDSGGDTVFTLTVEGAQSKDWEDMASFRWRGRDLLLAADIGDNQGRKPVRRLYLIDEPLLPPGNAGSVVQPFWKQIAFRFPEGSPDCEAVAVDAESERVLLIEKRRGGRSGVYSLPLKAADPREPATAVRIGDIGATLVTGMDVSRDGRRAIVGTYLGAFEYSRPEGKGWAEVLASPPRLVTSPFRQQGEAICYSADGDAILWSSEGRNTPLWRAKRRPAAEP